MLKLGEAGRQVPYSKPPEAAFDDVCRALELIGKIRQADKAALTIRGTCRYGFQAIDLRIQVGPRDGASLIDIRAFSDDIRASGARHGTDRLLETLSNLDNPDYKPSKTGLSPASMLLRLAGFVILVLALLVVFASTPSWGTRAIVAFGVIVLAYFLISRARWRSGRGGNH
jgi:hypothetical protein